MDMLTNIMEKRKKYLVGNYFTGRKGEIEYPCNQYTRIRYWYKFLYQKFRYKLKKGLYNILEKL